MNRFKPYLLTRWAASAFEACDVPVPDAALAAAVLIRTSLRGIDTHGISRLPAYLEKLRSLEVNPRACPVIESTSGALQVDGQGGLGQVVAMQAVDAAIAATETQASVTCVLRDSGHLASLGLFVLRAAEQGRVALLCQKTSPIMGLPGTRGGAIGNNPIAFAAPLVARPPLVFDMASSVVARGHVLHAQREGLAIPDDWSLGPDGEPTTDPAMALQGSMQPIAQHKGIGLAMMVECLAGGRTGLVAEPSDATQPGSGSAGGVSAFLLVINPDLFVGRSAFDRSMSAWLSHYLRASDKEGRYPGQRQAESERHRSEQGIPIAEGVMSELRSAGAAVGRPFIA